MEQMKTIKKIFISYLITVGILNGVVNAMGHVYTLQTKSGIKQVQVNDCVTIKTENGPIRVTIVDINSESESDDDAIYTIEVPKGAGESNELIDISADETQDKILG